MQNGKSGSGRYMSFSSSSATVRLSNMRPRTLPTMIAAPRYGGAQTPEWVANAQQFFNRNALFLGLLAAVALIAALAVPAWAALQPRDAGTRLGTVNSSIGVTGTASTLVADLNTETFLGGLPFVQQSNVMSASIGITSAPQRFVLGIREARVGEYIQGVGHQMVLPYLNDTAIMKTNVDAWQSAVAQQQALAIANVPYVAGFQTPAIPAGTVFASAHATFYTCLGGNFCGAMANGQIVFDGAAACSFNMPFGTKFFLNNDPGRRVYTCLDRGALSTPWVDIWFMDPADGWAWQRMIGGTSSDITIVG